MSFTDISFVFIFLPVALIFYYLIGKRCRPYVLLLVSMLFYAWGSLQYFSLFVLIVVANVIIGRRMDSLEKPAARRILLILGIVVDVSVLGYYKYVDFGIETWGNLTGKSYELRNLALPLGISFFTFKAISYLVDIYLKKITLEDNLVHDTLYLSFFGQVQSGPLSRYSDMTSIPDREKGIKKKLCRFSGGLLRFLVGFCKKILLADILSRITTEIFSAGFSDFSVSYAWLGAICYSLQLFFDFSAYSDMAIGISGMFGYDCPENFNYPYTTESVSEFWRRWHITLGAWFRDYIYIPLGGSRTEKKWKTYFNLLVVWILTGIWHGASWQFVLWGLGYFIVISFEKLTGLPQRIKSKIGKWIYRIFTLFFVNLQWVIFRGDGIEKGLGHIRRMFYCQANPLADMRTVFLLKEYGIIIAVAILLCTPVAPVIEKKAASCKGGRVAYNIVSTVIIAFLFILALSFIVAAGNNPFAYANF